jgi:hypothetical protein
LALLGHKIEEIVKLPAHSAGLPGKVISFYIVPLDPAYPARAGRGTFRSSYQFCFFKAICLNFSLNLSPFGVIEFVGFVEFVGLLGY